MGTLFLDRSDVEIRSEGTSLAFYEAGERRGTIPLNLLERLVIQGSQTRLDTGVLLKLAEAGTATLLLSPRVARRVAIVLGPAHNDAGIRLAQAHRVLDEAFVLDWARDLVLAKLRRQHGFLDHAETSRPDVRKPLFDARAALERGIEKIRSGAVLEVKSLRGIEGAAARAYFQGFGALLPPALKFRGRTRRPPRDPANVCMSLAYTMLHFDAVRAAHAAGLDPLLGFYHRPAFGRESLASDLIEPLRPIADAWIWQLLRERTLREDNFTFNKDVCLLGKAGRERFYGEWERFAPPARRWLRARCARLARVLGKEGGAWLVHDDDEAD
jgi:CRISPR-associated protein Cas1